MDQKIEKSLRYSLIDGIFASVMTGFSETFITPYALAMKASAGLVGILASLPNLIGSLLQVKAADLVDFLGSRKAVINITVLIHALMWLPIIAIPYLFENHQPFYLIIFYTLLISIGLVSFPPWSSLMSDHVPEAERGKVFGRRNRIFGLINVSSMFLAGAILYIFKKFVFAGSAGNNDAAKLSFLGFTIIFSIAFVARLFSWNFLRKMYEPPLVIKDEHRFTIIDFLKRLRKANFGRFVLFTALMSFSVNIAAPFFAVYMIRDLKFSYLTYTILTMASTLTMILMMNAWGMRADHVGNVKILRFTSLFVPLIPLLWLFSANVIYLIFVQIFAGFFWAGYNLSASNFIYDAVTPEKRIRCIAYFNVINGVAIFSGAALGGYLVKLLPLLPSFRMQALFLVSGLLRILAAFISGSIKEVRKVKSVSNLELFYSVISRRPFISPVSSDKE